MLDLFECKCRLGFLGIVSDDCKSYVFCVKILGEASVIFACSVEMFCFLLQLAQIKQGCIPIPVVLQVF